MVRSVIFWLIDWDNFEFNLGILMVIIVLNGKEKNFF